jgi:hypothetical protein
MKRKREVNYENLFNLVFEDINLYNSNETSQAYNYYLNNPTSNNFAFFSKITEYIEELIFYHNSHFIQRLYKPESLSKTIYDVSKRILSVRYIPKSETSLIEPLPKDIYFQFQ